MTTKHNHAMVFGRRSTGCPRCHELSAGAPTRTGWGSAKRAAEVDRIAAIRAHDFAACMRRNMVCVCFDS